MMDQGAAPLITPVVRERVTVMVMDLLRGRRMTDMEGVKETLFVVGITARSLVLTIIMKMTVVRSQASQRVTKNGMPGVPGSKHYICG